MARVFVLALGAAVLSCRARPVARAGEAERPPQNAQVPAPTQDDCDRAEELCGRTFGSDCAGLPEPACFKPCWHPHGLTADGGINDECWRCITARTDECVPLKLAGDAACALLPRCARR